MVTSKLSLGTISTSFGMLQYKRSPDNLKCNRVDEYGLKRHGCGHKDLAPICEERVLLEWLNSDFIPWNGKIFEFSKNFNAIWFGIENNPYAEISGRLRAVWLKISSKMWYRYSWPCIWDKSFKIAVFSKTKSCSGFSMKNCWTVFLCYPRFSTTLELCVF